jgi:hypothetical protein
MFKHSTSIFDDFIHYEKRQEEDEGRRVPPPQVCNYAFYQCCGSESGIRCLLDQWIRDLE